jgi:hypothetical protein
MEDETTEKNHISQADSRSASQLIRTFSWNSKINYRVHKSPPLEPILSHTDPHIFLLNETFLQRLRVPSGPFHSDIPNASLYAFVVSAVCVTCFINFTVLASITLN